MRERSFCYRKLWKKPITIHSFQFRGAVIPLPKAVEVRQIIVASLILAVMYMFRQPINNFLPMQLDILVYIFVPYFLAKWITGINIQGKRLDRYLIKRALFIFTSRYSYSRGKAVYRPQMKQKQTYSKFEVKSDE